MTPEERKSLKRASNLVYKYDTLLLLLTHFFLQVPDWTIFTIYEVSVNRKRSTNSKVFTTALTELAFLA